MPHRHLSQRDLAKEKPRPPKAPRKRTCPISQQGASRQLCGTGCNGRHISTLAQAMESCSPIHANEVISLLKRKINAPKKPKARREAELCWTRMPGSLPLSDAEGPVLTRWRS